MRISLPLQPEFVLLVVGGRGHIHQVRRPVADVTTAVGDRKDPFLEGQFAVHLRVDPADADAFARNAGEVGLAAGADAEAAVQHVVPHRPLGVTGRVHRADEIDRGDGLTVRPGDLVRRVDDELVGADAVVGRHVEGR